MEYNNYIVTVNKHGVEVTKTERFNKPYYFFSYNPGGGELYQTGTLEEYLPNEPENITADDVLFIMGRGF